MPSYSASQRPLTIRTQPPTEGLLLVGIEGHEGISQLFHFRLTLLAANDRPVSFALLGQEATVTLHLEDSTLRHFSGLISRLTQGGRDQEFTHFQADLVPRLWLRTKRVQSRIFQQLSVPDILKQVLADLDVVYQLSSDYEPRDYCTQYEESDFAFVSRLMEQGGFHYYFRHGEDGHQLVISDSTVYPKLPIGNTVIYDAALASGQEVRIREWSKTQEVCASQYTLWDHHFELPDTHLEKRANVGELVTVGQVEHRLRSGANRDLERFEFPGGYAQRFDGVGPGGTDQAANLQKIFSEGERVAGLRAEEEAAHSLMIQGTGNCGQLLPGHTFTLQGHFDADGSYLVKRVDHRATMSGDRSGQERTWEYANRFECLPASLLYRPQRLTPRPVIAGTQTATVTGIADQPLFVDKYGRVKVQFHWDRQGQLDPNSSCWVRVAQVWAGKRWGGHFWPRQGHEVVVAFHNGNPDEPLIVGSVYNARNMPPFPLPERALYGGIKSATGGRDASPMHDFNAVIFDDRPGNERLQLHSVRDMVSNHVAGQMVRSGGNYTRIVGGRDGVGSGGGGGSESDQPAVSTADLPAITDPLTFATETEVTFGQRISAASYFNSEYFLGSTSSTFVNPLGLISLYRKKASPLSQVLGTFFGGSLDMKIGTSTELLYGTNIDIKRGFGIEYGGDPWPARAFGLAIWTLAGMLGTTNLINFALAASEPKHTTETAFANQTLSSLMTTILVWMEHHQAMVAVGARYTQAGVHYTRQGAAQLQQGVAHLGYGVQALEKLAKSIAFLASGTAEPGTREFFYDVPAKFSAKNSLDLSAHFEVPTAPTTPPASQDATVRIAAMTDAAPAGKGVIALDATSAIRLHTGGSSPAGISIDESIPTKGKVDIKRSSIPTDARIHLGLDGIKLLCGPPGEILLQCGASSILIGADKITMQAPTLEMLATTAVTIGEAAGSTVQMGAGALMMSGLSVSADAGLGVMINSNLVNIQGTKLTTNMSEFLGGAGAAGGTKQKGDAAAVKAMMTAATTKVTASVAAAAAP